MEIQDSRVTPPEAPKHNSDHVSLVLIVMLMATGLTNVLLGFYNSAKSLDQPNAGWADQFGFWEAFMGFLFIGLPIGLYLEFVRPKQSKR
jgi:hypothetical protein